MRDHRRGRLAFTARRRQAGNVKDDHVKLIFKLATRYFIDLTQPEIANAVQEELVIMPAGNVEQHGAAPADYRLRPVRQRHRSATPAGQALERLVLLDPLEQ